MSLHLNWKTAFLALLISIAGMWAMSSQSFADSYKIDQADVSKGIIHVSCEVSDTTKVKLMVQKGDKKYVYDLKNNGSEETFPLQLGNGDYTVGIFKNITENKYAPVASETVTLALENENIIFLQAIQNVYFTASSQAVKKADELIKDFKEGSVKLQKVYDFIVANYKYDYAKAASVKTGYIPDVDEMYVKKKGICYDYSALFAAMLRSHEVPTKLVKGYAKLVDGYHAWNEVYDEKSKSWVIIDTTVDAQMKALKKKVTIKKSSTEYQTVNIY